jgi:hypothetical protein
MGLFKKLQDGIVNAGQAAADRAAAAQPTDPDAIAAQQRAMGIDTANFGGPSNAPVADDDPIWAPIAGVDLPTYARVAKAGQAAGVTDEAGMAVVAQEQGLDPAAWAEASKGWIDRMGQNMAVGQRFRQHLDAS